MTVHVFSNMFGRTEHDFAPSADIYPVNTFMYMETPGASGWYVAVYSPTKALIDKQGKKIMRESKNQWKNVKPEAVPKRHQATMLLITS